MIHDVGEHKLPRNKYRSRPYWNEQLSALWADARLAERHYLKSKS